MSQNVLRLDNITMQFGGVVAVDNLSLDVNEGRDRRAQSVPTARQHHRIQHHHRRV